MIRDIGADNQFSMKDGVIFPHKRQLQVFLFTTFLLNYNSCYKSTPRRFKVHRSLHPWLLLGVSIYVPYRYQATINTIMFQLVSNPIMSRVARVPIKFLVYGFSVFMGQLAARFYWVYKRSFCAAKFATLNTYLQWKTYQNSANKYPYFAAFREVRPNLVQ